VLLESRLEWRRHQPAYNPSDSHFSFVGRGRNVEKQVKMPTNNQKALAPSVGSSFFVYNSSQAVAVVVVVVFLLLLVKFFAGLFGCLGVHLWGRSTAADKSADSSGSFYPFSSSRLFSLVLLNLLVTSQVPCPGTCIAAKVSPMLGFGREFRMRIAAVFFLRFLILFDFLDLDVLLLQVHSLKWHLLRQSGVHLNVCNNTVGKKNPSVFLSGRKRKPTENAFGLVWLVEAETEEMNPVKRRQKR
jgi:hypothetical protein